MRLLKRLNAKGTSWGSKPALKMIILLILISISLFGISCSEEMAEDPELELQKDRVMLPDPDPSILDSGGPEVTSAFPPDIDRDADGYIDYPLEKFPDLLVDNCLGVANPDQTDSNRDGIGDACE